MKGKLQQQQSPSNQCPSYWCLLSVHIQLATWDWQSSMYCCCSPIFISHIRCYITKTGQLAAPLLYNHIYMHMLANEPNNKNQHSAPIICLQVVHFTLLNHGQSCKWGCNATCVFYLVKFFVLYLDGSCYKGIFTISMISIIIFIHNMLASVQAQGGINHLALRYYSLMR